MIITNNYNLPEAVLNVISRDNYVRGDNNYSVTELIESPQVVQLKRRHWNDLTEDAIDRVWSVFGHAVHHLMETHASDESFVEQRYYINRLGRTIGGMVDCYNNGVISDYKVTSAWSLVYGSREEHWAQQLNMYAHILRENGLPVTNLQIIAFLRDWDRNKAKMDRNYPQVPLMIIPIDLWAPAQAELYITERLSLHIANEEIDASSLRPCTSEEMWERPSTYAVMKSGAKRATRVFDSWDEASAFADTQGVGFSVVERVGKRTRCEDYCNMRDYCRQYQQYTLYAGV